MVTANWLTIESAAMLIGTNITELIELIVIIECTTYSNILNCV